MKKEDDIEVRISHPHGLDMRFSESVTKFLITRSNKGKPFRAGQWVTTLSDDVIAHLEQLAEAFLHDGADVYLDDIVQASILAVAAETGKHSVTVSPELLYEWVGALGFIVALERMKRDELIELDVDVGISTIREAKVTLTDRGMQAGLDLRSRMS